MATKKKEATLEENFAELDAMLAKLATGRAIGGVLYDLRRGHEASEGLWR